jgi:hypothetical protein
MQLFYTTKFQTRLPMAKGIFALPCNTTVDISLVFGGTPFTISPKDYVGAQLTGTLSNLCTSNIVGQQIGNADQWLVGDVFLKNVYLSQRSAHDRFITVFDFDNNQIGFGSKPTVGTGSSTRNKISFMAASEAGPKKFGGMNVVLGYGAIVVISLILL